MFAGFLIFSDLISDPIMDTAAISAALSPYHCPDREGVWQSGPLQLLAQRVFNAPESLDELLPCRCTETGVALAFWGRLDNRGELADKLSICSEALQHLTDSQLTLAAWRRWGESLPEHLLGDFALAVMDAEKRKVFLARDAIGVKPLYYALTGQLLAFATTVAALREIKSLSLTPDTTWIARYLVGSAASRRDTGFRSVVKLPPGHCLVVDSRGHEQLRQWFHFRDDAPDATRRDAHWVKAYREQLEAAIRCRMNSNYPLGTENSGGIDSGTITTFLARFLGKPGDQLYSLGYALSEDDPAVILEICQAQQIMHNHIVTADSSTETREAEIKHSLRVLGYPEEDSNGSGHIPFYRECKVHGIRTLFSGFGGDEVVTNPGGRMLRFEYLDSGHYQQLWDILPGNWLTRSLRLGKLAAVGRKKLKYNPGFHAAWNARWPHQLLRADVVENLGVHQTYMEGAQYDGPYRRINDFILNSHLITPYVASRLENCTLLAASYGVEYRWPLWDTRLVQQYLSTPSCEKVGPKGIGRYLHRRAVDDVVLPKVTWKPLKNLSRLRVHPEIAAKHLQLAASIGQHQEAHLHPALDALIDRDKFRQQIKQASLGSKDETFTSVFQDNVDAIRWLNQWLHDAST